MRVNDAWQTLAESRVAQAPVVDERGPGHRVAAACRHGTAGLAARAGAVKEAIELARRPVSEVMYSPVAAVAPTRPCAAWPGCCWTRACRACR